MSPELNTKLPSGYSHSLLTVQTVIVGPEILPWLVEPVDLSVSELTLASQHRFLVASAIKTSGKLITAASAMTEKQNKITDNMFYSRIPEYIIRGVSSNIEAFPDPITSFPIKVLRNNGGQRVYFSRVNLGHVREPELGGIILKLAACDKGKQPLAMDVLSSSTKRSKKRRRAK